MSVNWGAADSNAVGALGLFMTHKRHPGSLLDHLVGAAEQRERDGEAEGLGSPEIYDQLDFRGLLDRQISRLPTLENSPGVNADQTIVIRFIASVAHQTAGRGKLAIVVDCGHRVADRQCGKLVAPGIEEYIGHDHEA